MVGSVLLLLLWGGASILCGVVVAFSYGQIHRWWRGTQKGWDKPDLDLLFVTFTLLAFPLVGCWVGIIVRKLTSVHISAPVDVYLDVRGQTSIASLGIASRLEFRGIEEGKDHHLVRVRLPDGQEGFILDHERVEIRYPF